MAKIKLTIKNGDNKESVQFEIDRVTTLQVLKLKGEIAGVARELKANGELGEFMEILFNGDDIDLESEDAQAQALESAKDKQFMTSLAGAFDKLIDILPDRAFNILSIISGIEKDVLEKIYFDELFDVYDAIMEENDIEKIVGRMKTSFFATKGQWGNLIRNMFDKQGK